MTKSGHVARIIGALALLIAVAACRPAPAPAPTAIPTVAIAQPTPITAPTARPTPSPAPPTITPSPLPSAAPSPTPTAPVVLSPTAASSVAAVAPAAVPSLPTPPPRDLVDLAHRLNASAVQATRTPGPPPDYAVGTDQTFWVANQVARNYFKMGARIVAKTSHAYWYVQDGVDIPSDQVEQAANYFEQHTYPTEHALFGHEWSPGIDNDVHITILLGHIPGVGGYFSTADEYQRDINPYSNQREMIYINVDSVRPGGFDFNGTVAHEFMHMIQFNVNRQQNSWVDEGSAELAAQAVTGATSGSLSAFERQPDTQLNAWASDPTAAIPHYGAAYLFMRYVSDRFGGFHAIGDVIAEPARGIASFERFFRAQSPPTTFDQVFADWVAANALDDPSLGHGQYGYKSLKLTPTLDPGPAMGSTLSGQAHQFGTDYYEIKPTAPATIVFDGERTTQLIGANPHDASLEWWSNRGDSIDTRLTRPVDLRHVHTATLHFWIWYDIEKDFDYGYVEVSTDGGKTWTTLATQDTTTSNPNGQNYGNGFTGTSGGTTPRWVAETANLDAYAGKQILLRFEYVTDDSYNADGFAIDGVEIPEIGFHGTTNTDDGWTAQGFVRITNQWPESYLVEALSPSSASPVQQMRLDANEHGTLKVPGGKTVIVAVAGLAPLTTHTAPFELRLQPG